MSSGKLRLIRVATMIGRSAACGNGRLVPACRSSTSRVRAATGPVGSGGGWSTIACTTTGPNSFSNSVGSKK